MAGNYRCTHMLLQIVAGGTTYTISVVEGMDIKLEFNGGWEPVYGSDEEKYSRGTKKATYSLVRWYMADEGQQGLFYWLFDKEIEFQLTGKLQEHDGTPVNSGHTAIVINGCHVQSYHPKTGAANDVIGEECTGGGANWDDTDIQDIP